MHTAFVRAALHTMWPVDSVHKEVVQQLQWACRLVFLQNGHQDVVRRPCQLELALVLQQFDFFQREIENPLVDKIPLLYSS